MRDLPLGFASLYVSALREHIKQSGEEGLHQAYELGRRALQEGVGVIDLVGLHHDALAGLMFNEAGDDPVETVAPAAEFLAECLSPFEMTLRGYQEANERLAAANAELSEANAAVVQANAMLQAEAAERKRAEEALLHAQKLQAVGLLAGGVAHHFNNLLTVVLGNIELARRRIAANSEVDAFLVAARRGAQRGAEVARQLLTFSRQQILQPRVLDTPGWLKELTPLLSAALGGHIAVEIEADVSVWPVQVDPSELELTLLNLGVNARDAMPEGGVLRVTAENRTLDDDPLGLHGEYVLISVADTGVGVPPELLKRVFEPFFTTKSLGPGAGLGLAQVHGFVHQSGGQVEMDSVLGHGATVRLYLPAATHQPAATAAKPAVAPRKPKKGFGRVLLVEDDADVAETAAALLRNCGYSVKLADRAQSALDLMQDGERVDLIFSDVVMPGGMNGVQLAEELRRRFPKLPILLATGYSDVIAGAEAKGLAVIAKPYQTEELRDRIDRLLGLRRP